MRFDYHKYSSFLECPRKYNFGATETPPPVQDNKYYAVYGQFVQKFFELYSNGHIPTKISLTHSGISRFMRPFWENILRYSYVDWKAPMCRMSQEEFYDDAIKVIVANLLKLDLYREGTRSELKIEVTLKSGDTLVSKIDFEKRYADGRIALLDGKTTSQVGKNVDSGQLLFYAGMYQAQYKKIPDELAFIYYKMQVKERVPFDATDVKALVTDVIGTMNVIKSTTEFKPTPSAQACKYCSWKGLCPEGTADMNSRKRGPRGSKVLNLAASEDDSDYIDITMSS